jgi:ABC-2 type transport system ATP-binding protein
MANILEVQDLHKSYGSVKAVDGVSFSIPDGICFGLLGPNGAGKTTTVEMLETILEPDAGDIRFRGKPIGGHYKERVGIQFQSTALQQYITVKETLTLFSSLYPKKRPLDEIIEICALEELLDRDNQKLSGGQRQRLLFGLALVNDPELLYLDEPTTGLDPQARRNFWALIENIKTEGKTVVLTTHYMDEAEILCEEIAIMDRGKIIAQGPPDDLVRSNFEGVIISVPYDSEGGVATGSLPGDATVRDGKVEIETSDIEASLRSLLDYDISLDGLNVHTADLDDLFLKLTGTTLRS